MHVGWGSHGVTSSTNSCQSFVFHGLIMKNTGLKDFMVLNHGVLEY